MSVRKKLNIGFISLICLLLILSILSFLQFKVAKRDIDETLNYRIVQMQLTQKNTATACLSRPIFTFLYFK